MKDDHCTKLVPYDIPCSTLKDYTENFWKILQNLLQQILDLPCSIEIIAVNYILSTQDVGFSLTVGHVTCVVFKVVEAAGITHLFL